MQKLRGIPDKTYILTSTGWEQIRNITLSTKLVTYSESRDRRFKPLSPVSLSSFPYKGLIPVYQFKGEEFSISRTTKIKGYEFNPQGLNGNLSFLNNGLKKYKGDLVFLLFKEPCGVILRVDIELTRINSKNLEEPIITNDYYILDIK